MRSSALSHPASLPALCPGRLEGNCDPPPGVSFHYFVFQTLSIFHLIPIPSGRQTDKTDRQPLPAVPSSSPSTPTEAQRSFLFLSSSISPFLVSFLLSLCQPPPKVRRSIPLVTFFAQYRRRRDYKTTFGPPARNN